MRLLYGGDQPLGRGVFEQVVSRASPQTPKTYSSLSKVVSMMAATRGYSSERRLISSTPSMRGMRASTSATSGGRQDSKGVDAVCGLAHHLDGVL